jgi:Carboxypeptidase regulatory-like domain/Putative zinc-finger
MSEEYHPGLHPNADALSAFLEGVLPEHERAECLTHLANCVQCREVVFLAREAAETEEPAAVQEAAVPFWRKLLRPMPVLAAAATAILFFSVGLYRMIRPAEQKPVVIADVEQPVPAPKAEPEISTQAVPQEARNAIHQLKSVPSKTVQPAPRKASPVPVLVGRAQAQAEAVVPSPPLPVTPPATVSSTPPPAPAPVAVPAGPPGPAGARFAAAPRVAEATGAGVAGTITDPTGAAIARAQVELKNDDTGATYKSASDARGQFRIGGLAPGRYDLSVTSMGFRKFMRPSIEVQPETIARVDSTLDFGAATETVTVAAQPPLLKTEGGAVATTGSVASAGLPLNRAMVRTVPTEPNYQLPGKKPAVTFAAKDRVVVAADAEGALFFSDNQGKNWKHIKGKWKGKVVRVASPPSVPGSTNAVFELITDPASTWVSADGRTWTVAPASR